MSLQLTAAAKDESVKAGEKLQEKIIELEKKLTSVESDAEDSMQRLNEEVASLKEFLSAAAKVITLLFTTIHSFKSFEWCSDRSCTACILLLAFIACVNRRGTRVGRTSHGSDLCFSRPLQQLPRAKPRLRNHSNCENNGTFEKLCLLQLLGS